MAIVPLALAVIAVRPYLWGSGSSTPVSLEEVIRRYQEAASSTAVPVTVPSTASVTTLPVTVPATDLAVAPALPQPGVYVYATSGGDSVDALGGDHHVYPETTTITVTEHGCGVLQRWDLLVERWEEWQRCVVGDGIAFVGRTNFDSFFGRSQTDRYECTGDARPARAEFGRTWSFVCRQGDEVDRYDGVVVGVERLVVAQRTVEALHVRVSIDNGTVGDSQVTDSWYLMGSDLLLAQTGANDTTNPSPVGDVHYTERYEMQLTDLVPQT